MWAIQCARCGHQNCGAAIMRALKTNVSAAVRTGERVLDFEGGNASVAV